MKTMRMILLPLAMLAARQAVAVYSVANGTDGELPMVFSIRTGNGTASNNLGLLSPDIWSDHDVPHSDADYVMMSNHTEYVLTTIVNFNGHSLQIGTTDYSLKNSWSKGSLYCYNRSDPGKTRYIGTFANEGLILVNGSVRMRYYNDTEIAGKVKVLSNAANPFTLYYSRTDKSNLEGYLHLHGPVSGPSTAALRFTANQMMPWSGLKIGNDWSQYYGTLIMTNTVSATNLTWASYGIDRKIGDLVQTRLLITNTVVSGTVTMHNATLLKSLVAGQPFTVSNLVLKAGSTFDLSGDVTVGSLTMEGGAKINVIPSAGGTVLPTITVLDSVSVSGGAAEFTINGYSFDAGAAATVLTLPAGAAVTPADFTFTGTSLASAGGVTFAIQTVVEDGADACRVKARFTRDLMLAADATLALSSDMTVTSIEAEGGATITFSAASGGLSFPSLTVLDSISVTDDKLNIVLSGYADTNGANSAVLTLPAGTTLTADDLSVTGVSAAGLPFAADEVTLAVDAVTGAVTVTPVFNPIVSLLTGDDTSRVSEKSSAITNATQWSDRQVPHDGAHYYLPASRNLRIYDNLPCSQYNAPTLDYTFPGDSLTLWTSASITFICRSVTAPQMYVRGAGSSGINTPAYTRTSTWHGDMEIAEGAAINFNVGYNKTFVFDGDITGSGSLALRGLGGGGTSQPSGHVRLPHLNTNFTGRTTLTIPIGGGGTSVTPQFATKFLTFYAEDARNLGGPMEPADPKGITIRNMSRLAVMDGTYDVTFDEPTRGIFIYWAGRFNPTNGQTITVKSPLAVHGTMYKEGAGVLALGSEVKFGADGTLDAWEAGEDATNHTFKVLGGDVRILHADALNGLNVAVSNSASAFRLAACPADPDLKAYGIRNVKTDAPFAVEVEGAKLNIQLEAPEVLPRAQDTFGLVTVPIAQTNAVAQLLTVRRPETGFDGFGVKVAVEANGDGETATFKATVHTRGTMFTLR